MGCFKRLGTTVILWVLWLWEYPFFRFLVAGAPGAALSFTAIFIAVNYGHWSKPMAILVMGSIGHAINFYPIKIIAYKNKTRSVKRIEIQILEHVTLGIVFSAVAASMVIFGKSLSDHINWLYLLIKVIIDLLSNAVIYFIERAYVFFEKSSESQNPI